MVSVIICTRNRAKSLTNTLRSLTEMFMPKDLRWEILVVDNYSTDDTKAVVEHVQSTWKGTLRYLVEEQIGLSCARNKGVAEAKGNILAFTDDDCIVSSAWISSMISHFVCDPSLAGLGGRIELHNPHDQPVSIRTSKVQATFSSTKQLFTMFAGCNMAFSRHVFSTIGNFDEDLGAGTKFYSAEDSDLLYRAYQSGFKIIYAPDVLVFHNHGRKTLKQVETQLRGYFIGRGAFYFKQILRGEGEILKLAIREIISLFKSIVKHVVKFQPFKKQRDCLSALMIGFAWKAFSAIRAKAS